MAYTVLKLMHNMKIGNSQFDAQEAKIVEKFLNIAEMKSIQIHLPVNIVIANKFSGNVIFGGSDVQRGIPDGWMGLDIGQKSWEFIAELIKKVNTSIRNESTGVFEFEHFSKGIKNLMNNVIKAMTDGTITIIIGDDTATCSANWNTEDKFIYESTSCDAGLELLEEKDPYSSPGLSNEIKKKLDYVKQWNSDIDDMLSPLHLDEAKLVPVESFTEYLEFSVIDDELVKEYIRFLSLKYGNNHTEYSDVIHSKKLYLAKLLNEWREKDESISDFTSIFFMNKLDLIIDQAFKGGIYNLSTTVYPE